MIGDQVPRATSTACCELLALRQGVYSVVSQDGELCLVAWPHTESFGQLDAGQRTVLNVLADEPHTEADLYSLAREHNADQNTNSVAQLLDQLRAGGWLALTLSEEGRNLYTLEPLRPPPAPPEKIEPELLLSRFALLRRHGSGIVVESPRAWCDVRVHDSSVLVVLGELATSGSAAVVRSLSVEAGERMLRDLRWAEIAVTAADIEETDLQLRQWSPHELWFHERSRLGHHNSLGNGFGGTFWAKGSFDPLPAVRDPYAGAVIDLYRPDLNALQSADSTLTTVLESRRSIRTHDDDHPLNLGQLGEFLYRCARTRLMRTVDGVEYASRPYPSGGSAYELELYTVVRHAADLDPGMYHYDSYDHQLRLVREPTHSSVRRLLRGTAHSSSARTPPQILIVIAARVGRLMWKYEGMPYALILKHVGVLHQTMYCVATAMGLAPCGLGSGDSVAFTEATGTNPFIECSVGEFMLGSRPVEAPAGAALR